MRALCSPGCRRRRDGTRNVSAVKTVSAVVVREMMVMGVSLGDGDPSYSAG